MSEQKLANEQTLIAQQRELVLRGEASKRASADPLPGPLANAFASLPISVTVSTINGEQKEYKVRPLVAYDWAMFKQLNSPVFRMMQEIMQVGVEKAEMINAEPHEDWELCYLLTRPCAESDRVFMKGRAGFTQSAKEEFGFQLDTAQIVELMKACLEQVRAHMSTMTKYAVQAEAQDAPAGSPESFFANSSQQNQTGSAGGSDT